jgi:diguanylate cyclase (GGDEF)-like protein
MMSVIRQVWLLLFAVLLFALAGGVLTHTLMTRQALHLQQQMRNDDGAAVLALALAQQRGDANGMRRVAEAQFDAGHYRRLRLLGTDGRVLFERQHPARAGVAPDWFASLLAVQAAPGVAQVNDGRQPFGSLQLSGQSDWATDALWAGSVGMIGWLALLGLIAAAVAAAALRAWQRPFDAAVAQARALEEGRFVIADEPRVPELKRLTRSMNSLVRRLQGMFESQAAQLEELRSQAHKDAVTGLSNRRQFVAQLNAALQAERHRGAGLLLVRLRQLQAMNRRIGHEATDRLLAALAQVLESYPRHVKGALAGRLNGTDFALFLPAAGMAAETARSLVDALRAALATVDQGAELVIGGVDLPQATGAAAALSIADAALARAESGGPFTVEIAAGALVNAPVLGERQWHARISQALQSGRLALAEFLVADRNGRLLHLDCPMRMQFDAAGPFEPAVRWLAMAVRGKLIAQVDLAAVTLALAAVQRDGLPRCVNVSAASLATAGFIAEVQQRLEAAPQEAARLWVDFAEGAALQATRVREAGTRWRPLGVRLGLEHAGAQLRDLSRLHALGIDYVKIDGAFVQGVASVPAVRELARGLVTLLRGMDLQILAESVEDDADLAALWVLGFDGATGPALRGTTGS